MDLILTGRAVDAAEAVAFGLANRVVPAGRALPEAQHLAAELAAPPQTCLRSDRASVLDQEGPDEASALAREFAHGQQALPSEAGAGRPGSPRGRAATARPALSEVPGSLPGCAPADSWLQFAKKVTTYSAEGDGRGWQSKPRR